MGFTMTTEELLKFLEEQGFILSHQKKHLIYKKEKVTIAVPAHNGNLPKGLLTAILRQAGFKTKQAKDWQEGK